MSRPGNGVRYRFILQALDPALRRPILEALFDVASLEDIRVLLGPQAAGDPELHQLYYPTVDQLRMIIDRFDVPFDPGGRPVRLHNLEIRGRLPYLFHSGYELALLLDGTKQFGFVDHFYPPYRHEEEDLFDLHVSHGVLHKEAELEPWDPPVYKQDGRVCEGFRRVYYTRKDEEWRIAAHRLLWSTRQPWDATHERLWSMVFGYEDWQTDYWIAYNRERSGGWSGIPIYCSVNTEQLEALEAVAFRAFPRVIGEPLTFARSDERPTESEAMNLLAPDGVALVRANIRGRFLLEITREQPGPHFVVPTERHSEFNRNIVGLPELIVRRGSDQRAS